MLHYLDFDSTVNCVESIRSLQSFDDVQVVIVDNGSSNGTGKKLILKYQNISQIHVILNDENLGFARGNNIGYVFAKKKLCAEYICLSNNDILIHQKGFIDLLLYKERPRFDVLGPDIYIPSSEKHQNPQRLKGYSSQELESDIAKWKLIRAIYRGFPFRIVDLFYNRLLKILHTKPSIHKVDSVMRNIQLNGAFLIYGPHFIHNEDFAFDPRTFLYLEEDFLYHRCMRKGYVLLYDPCLKVIHNEHASTVMASKDVVARKISNLSYHIESANSLLKAFKESSMN